MKKVIIASVLALGLAACGGAGGGDKVAKLTKLCLEEDGSSQAECECMSKAAVDKLDPEMVDMLIEAGSKGDDADAAMAEMMGDLDMEQMQKFMTFAMESGSACGVEGMPE